MKKMKFLSNLGFAFLLLVGMQAMAQETVVDQGQLPDQAKNFMAQYFSNQAIANVVKDRGVFKTEYEVYLKDGSKLEFDGEGQWKEVKSKTEPLSNMAFIPEAIRNYVVQNYANQSIKAIEKGSRKYEVKLTNGLELEFGLAGNFLRIDD